MVPSLAICNRQPTHPFRAAPGLEVLAEPFDLVQAGHPGHRVRLGRAEAEQQALQARHREGVLGNGGAGRLIPMPKEIVQ